MYVSCSHSPPLSLAFCVSFDELLDITAYETSFTWRYELSVLSPQVPIKPRKLELNTGRQDPGNNGYWQLGDQDQHSPNQACMLIGRFGNFFRVSYQSINHHAVFRLLVPKLPVFLASGTTCYNPNSRGFGQDEVFLDIIPRLISFPV